MNETNGLPLNGTNDSKTGGFFKLVLNYLISLIFICFSHLKLKGIKFFFIFKWFFLSPFNILINQD
jgi:hypothetical protein